MILKFNKIAIIVLCTILLASCNKNDTNDLTFKELKNKLLYQKSDKRISNLTIKTKGKEPMLQFIRGEKHPNVKMFAMIIFLNDDKKYLSKILEILESINYKINNNFFLSLNSSIRIDFNDDIDKAILFAKKLFIEVYEVNGGNNNITITYETYDANSGQRTNEVVGRY